MAEKKNYISGILIKEVGQYNQLNISIKIDDFIEQLRKVENNGWCNLTIAKNRNPTDKGYTHHCYENTWKPEKKGSQSSQKTTEFAKEPEDDSNNSLPF